MSRLHPGIPWTLGFVNLARETHCEMHRDSQKTEPSVSHQDKQFPRNLQQDPTDPEKTWVSNSSIVTYWTGSVGKVPFNVWWRLHFLMQSSFIWFQPFKCSDLGGYLELTEISNLPMDDIYIYIPNWITQCSYVHRVTTNRQNPTQSWSWVLTSFPTKKTAKKKSRAKSRS